MRQQRTSKRLWDSWSSRVYFLPRRARARSGFFQRSRGSVICVIAWIIHQVWCGTTSTTAPSRNFASASSAAAGRSLFGKQGYLGVPLSDAEKSIYMNLRSIAPRTDVYLAISDSDTEEKWLIMSGPRKGQLFWDQTTSKYGPGAAGSGWSAQTDFWSDQPSFGRLVMPQLLRLY